MVAHPSKVQLNLSGWVQSWLTLDKTRISRLQNSGPLNYLSPFWALEAPGLFTSLLPGGCLFKNRAVTNPSGAHGFYNRTTASVDVCCLNVLPGDIKLGDSCMHFSNGHSSPWRAKNSCIPEWHGLHTTCWMWLPLIKITQTTFRGSFVPKMPVYGL